MQAINITLNNQHYRYAFYENQNTDQYGVFLIGNLQDIESVEYFSRTFSQTINILVIELPGTGLTNPLPATFSITEQSLLLLNLLAKLGITEAHILAFSYATPVALEFCKHFPGAQSLSMCGGMAGIPSKYRAITISIMADAFRDRAKFANEFIKGLTVNDPDIPRGKVIARSAKQKVYKYTDKQIECFCENTIRILSYKPTNLSSINIPSLLFIGEKDPYVTYQYAKELADSLPNCIFGVIPNADHLVHLEHPEKTAEKMTFLAKKKLLQHTKNYAYS